MDSITITVDHKAVTDLLGGMQRQIPFAMSKALNTTANEVQTAIRNSLASKFTLRRPEFVLRTIFRGADDKATKTRLTAVVRIDPRYPFLAKFEEGGTKVSTKAGGHIAIPTVNVRRTKKDLITDANRPRALLQSKAGLAGRVFIKKGAILRTVGKGASAITKALYLLRSSVKIPKLLGFDVTAQKTVDARWAANAVQAVDDAIRTAR